MMRKVREKASAREREGRERAQKRERTEVESDISKYRAWADRRHKTYCFQWPHH